MNSVKKYKKMINKNEFTIDSITLDFQRDDFIGPARIKDLDDELILNPPDQSHEIIDEHSFYYIIALDTDPYLFENRYNFVTGTIEGNDGLRCALKNYRVQKTGNTLLIFN